VNAVRFALGTLTILPVRPPEVLDRRVVGWAMTTAPLAGALLGLVAAAILSLDGPPLVLAAIAVAGLAVLSRALHLDGLADTADGLGSGRPAAGALDVMRKSDIGPFGVVALVLTLIAQVAALASLDPWPAVAAVVVSRCVLPLVCTPAFRAARAEGLGATVAGSVAWWQAAAALAVTCAVVFAAAAPYTLVGLPVGLALAAHCVRRFGGVTGDVYGACVELTFTASLVATALAG